MFLLLECQAEIQVSCTHKLMREMMTFIGSVYESQNSATADVMGFCEYVNETLRVPFLLAFRFIILKCRPVPRLSTQEY